MRFSDRKVKLDLQLREIPSQTVSTTRASSSERENACENDRRLERVFSCQLPFEGAFFTFGDGGVDFVS